MKLWLISFLLLLALVEGGQWLAHLALPWPVLLLTGAVLALISNGEGLRDQSLLRSQQPDQRPSR